LLDAHQVAVRLRDFQVGDRVQAVGVPSPDRALEYLGSRVIDSDLEAVRDQVGTVVSWNPNRHVLTVRTQSGQVETVSLVYRAAVVAPHNEKGVWRIHHGDRVTLTGVLDTRLHRVADITSVHISHSG
jgi:hypothetical protein